MGGWFALVPSRPTPHPPSNYATNPRVRDWGSPRRAVTAVRLPARSQARHRGGRPPVPSRRCGALRRGRSSGVSHSESVADAWTSLGFIADEALVAPEHLFDGVVPLVLCVDVGIHVGDLTLVRSMPARVPGRGRRPKFPRIGLTAPTAERSYAARPNIPAEDFLEERLPARAGRLGPIG